MSDFSLIKDVQCNQYLFRKELSHFEGFLQITTFCELAQEIEEAAKVAKETAHESSASSTTMVLKMKDNQKPPTNPKRS